MQHAADNAMYGVPLVTMCGGCGGCGGSMCQLSRHDVVMHEVLGYHDSIHALQWF